jgi:hypothetical protein
MTSERVRSAFQWAEFSVNLLDLERGLGVFWVQSAETLPYWTRSSPLRTLFHWWMNHTGAQLLHAAAIGTEDGALLLTGKGGVGKSTTALACLTSGLRYVADDYLIVRLEPEPRVYSLYSTAKLDGRQANRFPTLAALVSNPESLEREKAVLQLHPELAAWMPRSLPLRCIATPSFGDEPASSFVATSAAALERAAAFTTMSQLPHSGRTTYDFIRRMVDTLPGFELLLGHDVDAVPDAIRALLARSDAELASLAARAPGATEAPLVSVIIPVFEGGAFLPQAVDSVLAQRYPALEIIVVDDGSTEDIAGVVRQLPVDVRFFRQENAGPAAARNRGIRDASGDFIAFLDVDDLWPERNLELLVERLLADPTVDLVHGMAQPVLHRPGVPDEYVGSPREAYQYYIGAGLYRRRAFERVGLFDADLRFGEDSDWFGRAAQRGIRIEHLDAVTLFVRRHERNMTRGKTLVELQVLRVFKKGLDRRRAESAASD